MSLIHHDKSTMLLAVTEAKVIYNAELLLLVQDEGAVIKARGSARSNCTEDDGACSLDVQMLRLHSCRAASRFQASRRVMELCHESL